MAGHAQLMLQVLTPIFEPHFREHSYGFRPGRSAQDAVQAAQQFAREGKDWLVDMAAKRSPLRSDGHRQVLRPSES